MAVGLLLCGGIPRTGPLSILYLLWASMILRTQHLGAAKVTCQ